MQAYPQHEIDSIAEGVRSKYESLLGLSKIVTEETIGLSRILGIDKEKIPEWETKQKTQNLRGVLPG